MVLHIPTHALHHPYIHRLYPPALTSITYIYMPSLHAMPTCMRPTQINRAVVRESMSALKWSREQSGSDSRLDWLDFLPCASTRLLAGLVLGLR